MTLKISQGQIKKSRVYDDTIPSGDADLEVASASALDDLNGLRSQIQRVIGEGNWWRDAPISLRAVAAYLGGFRKNQSVTPPTDGAEVIFFTPETFLYSAAVDQSFLNPSVYLNGHRLEEVSDYILNESGGVGAGFDSIDFTPGGAPRTGDVIAVDYFISTGTIPPPAGGIGVYDESVLVAVRPAINFIGSAIQAVDNIGANRVDITVQITQDDILPAFVPSIVMSPGGPLEIGETVTNPAFTITASGGVIATYSVTDSDANGPTAGIGPAVAGITHPFAFVKSANGATVSFTAEVVSDAGVTKYPVDSLVWRPRVYYGDAAPGTIDEAFVENLGGSGLASSRTRTIAFSSGSGEKSYYAFPTAYGGGTPTFKDADTGFDAGFSQAVASVSITNSFGVSQTYEVWASDTAALGSYSVNVT